MDLYGALKAIDIIDPSPLIFNKEERLKAPSLEAGVLVGAGLAVNEEVFYIGLGAVVAG